MGGRCPFCRGFHRRRRGCLLCSSLWRLVPNLILILLLLLPLLLSRLLPKLPFLVIDLMIPSSFYPLFPNSS
ncbi:hypothetical protein CTA2_2784 [Colletotrichum tanaceti]|nr:hypothetical protein CTA2_2784 [Colletotrichum tanaceti]